MARRRKPVDENGVPFEQLFPGYEVNAQLKDTPRITTWRAWDLHMDRPVLLKELRPALVNREEVIEQFFSEVRSVAHIKHSNIARGLDTGRVGDRFYYVMEYIDGRTLADRIENGRAISEEEAARTAWDVGGALDYLYELGIVHADITPGNILFEEERGAILADLGVPIDILYDSPAARAAEHPSCAAPEQFDPEAFPDARTDLYAFGCTLYAALAGRLPFSGAKDEVARRHAEEEPDPLRTINPSIGAQFAGAVAALLAKNPDDRPQTPAQLLERLAEHPVILECRRQAQAQAEAARREREDLVTEEDYDADAAEEEVETEEEESMPESEETIS